MEIIKSLFLGIWLFSFGTIAYLYLALFRKLPPSTAVGTTAFASYTTYNLFWWIGLVACFTLAFVVVKSWPLKPYMWIALAVTELLPVGLLSLFLILMFKLKEAVK